jgi:RNA polymerase sigma-70 factor, ECF subfamily
MPDRAAPLAIAQLVADYHEPLYRYAYRLSGSAADAEDLTQQVFLIAHQKLDQVRDAQCVRGWLFTVLRNCYLKGRRKGIGLPIAELDVNTLPADPPAEVIDCQELQAALDTLGDEFKLVVVMFYFEHRSYREIAEQLEIPLGTVMSRLARAKTHLRERLTTVSDQTRAEVKPIESPLAGPNYHQPTVIRR